MKFVYFAAGFVMGGSLLWYITREKERNTATAKIKAMEGQYEEELAKYEKASRPQEKGEEDLMIKIDGGDKVEYNKLSKQYYRKSSDKETEPTTKRAGEPYLINTETFDTNDGEYRKDYLRYYADGTLVFENDDEPIDNPGEYLMSGFETLFGYDEEDPDIIHVRNPIDKTDYEITRTDEQWRP